MSREGAAANEEPALVHGTAEIEPGLRLHYATAEGAGPTVVLFHGFPQTWRAWRHVLPALTGAGHRVVALDYRGAGDSSRPLGGYDKRTMAADVYRLLTEHLQVASPVALVGHDIGLMVAYAYAQQFRDGVSHLAVLDAPLPGTAVFERLRADPRVWQFSFHAVRDLPEVLVYGRERLYLQAFIQARTFDPSAFAEADFDVYVRAYSAPGAMRAGFELYRAFDRDAADNREALATNGKLTIPVLAVGGATSTSGPRMEEMMREVAANVRAVLVPRSGHFIAEENPAFLVRELVAFLR